ncbi:uncharacterized protein LOC124291652 [Haliotis rubra]|uniref:uncharacterized protein LOC124291652 n=1 Tax=Haliotis rubra TaxID=36100 RepID=UPI001EE58469|nr:uncharacterized protein LOC124291652 [Haliotis rubra]
MRSVVGSVEEGVSATIFDNNNISSKPMASVVCNEHVQNVKDVQAADSVSLPTRYKKKLQQRGKETGEDEEKDLESREKDLGVALKWIRQEILQMKEQDKSLLKQFIELRANILQLRCMYEYHSSNSDVSSLEGSTASLNDAHKRRHKLPRSDSDFTSRTKSLLSLQGSPRCTRIKWRSDEYI